MGTRFDNGQEVVQTMCRAENFLKKRSIDFFDNRAKYVQFFTITIMKHSLKKTFQSFNLCNRIKNYEMMKQHTIF